MDGWKVYAMQDMADAAAQAFQEAEISEDARWRIFLDQLDGQELTTPSRLTARNFYFEDSIPTLHCNAPRRGKAWGTWSVWCR